MKKHTADTDPEAIRKLKQQLKNVKDDMTGLRRFADNLRTQIIIQEYDSFFGKVFDTIKTEHIVIASGDRRIFIAALNRVAYDALSENTYTTPDGTENVSDVSDGLSTTAD